MPSKHTSETHAFLERFVEATGRTNIKSVCAEFAREEGEHKPLDLPDEQVLEHWREGHWAIFERTLPLIGYTPQLDMPILCERFKVIYQEPSS